MPINFCPMEECGLGGGGGSGGGGGGGGGSGGGVIIDPPGLPPIGPPRRPPVGEEDPGDGDRPGRKPPSRQPELISEMLRLNASAGYMRVWNHRFRGHREAFKFNLLMCSALGTMQLCTGKLKPLNSSLSTRERAMYPTDIEITNAYHVRAQITFIEYMLLRDDDRRWFI